MNVKCHKSTNGRFGQNDKFATLSTFYLTVFKFLA